VTGRVEDWHLWKKSLKFCRFWALISETLNSSGGLGDDPRVFSGDGSACRRAVSVILSSFS
jgi:hypothetical protein